MKSSGAPATNLERWIVFPDSAALVTHAVARILSSADTAIAAHGLFRLVLAGGRTPLAVYAQLAAVRTDWSLWHWYFGDERCLPAGDAGRNDTAIRRVWLDHIVVPSTHIHVIRAELSAEAAVRHYAGLLASISEFDLVLLGLGEDGHTASLFPGQPLDADGGVLVVNDAPKSPSRRISLSAARLSRTRELFFLISGSDKRAAVAAWRAGANIPARAITGNVQVFLDSEAAPPELSVSTTRP